MNEKFVLVDAELRGMDGGTIVENESGRQVGHYPASCEDVAQQLEEEYPGCTIQIVHVDEDTEPVYRCDNRQAAVDTVRAMLDQLEAVRRGLALGKWAVKGEYGDCDTHIHTVERELKAIRDRIESEQIGEIADLFGATA